jgi:hypothetical protein
MKSVIGYGARCDRVKPDGSAEQARLDVVYMWQGRRVYVDLAVGPQPERHPFAVPCRS